MWLKELKIAIVEKNIDKLGSLVGNLPDLESSQEIDEALHLIKAATLLLEKLRDETKISLTQMKKNIDFLQATQAPHVSKLDINS